MTPAPPDQQTTHESVPDTSHVGRFSAGLETTPLSADKLHRGKFSEGLDQLPESPRKRHPGRFSDGLDRTPETASKWRHGSFSDARHCGSVAVGAGTTGIGHARPPSHRHGR